MIAPAKVTNREIVLTIFLKTLPATIAVVAIFRYGKRFLLDTGLAVPSMLYNFALILALLFVLRFTAWNMLQRLSSENPPRNE